VKALIALAESSVGAPEDAAGQTGAVSAEMEPSARPSRIRKIIAASEGTSAGGAGPNCEPALLTLRKTGGFMYTHVHADAEVDQHLYYARLGVLFCIIA
jgi:hypothetical protein